MNLGNNYLIHNKDGKLDNVIKDINYNDIKALFYENIKDKIECEKITQGSYNGESFYGKLGNWRTEFFMEVLRRDTKTSGFIMEYPHGVVIKQAERNHYYSGENQRFDSSIPSLLRTLNKLSENDRDIYEFITNMKIGEFKNFLYKFKYVQMWEEQYGTVLYECLAQHYGFETRWLDITNDFNTALFFATCYYDKSNKCWKPLTKDQTEKNENTKYGYIFHIPQWQCAEQNLIDFSNGFSDKKTPVNCILPIGFQPFERCHMQYGYGIRMEQEYPLQQDRTFEKLRFRHSEKLSKSVFDLMDVGKKIYPHEGINEFENIIKEINKTSTFSKAAFSYAVNLSNTISNENDFYNILRNAASDKINKNIRIDDNPQYSLGRAIRRNFDRKYAKFSIEKTYGIKPMTRLVYKPPTRKTE